MGARTRLASLAALAVGLLFVGGAVRYQKSLGSTAEVGRPAPGWALADLQGRTWRLQEFSGRPILINFWTTWCDPCREEIPGLEAFFRRFGDRLPIAGINVREPLPEVRAFVAQMGMTYPVLRDADGRVAERYRVRGYPESWFVDGDGVARRFWPGPLSFETLEQSYQELLGIPIAQGSRAGGPLAAAERGVAVARVGSRLFVASPARLLEGRLGSGAEMPADWRPVRWPTGAGTLTALAAVEGEQALAVAFGPQLWLYDVRAERWQALGQAAGPLTALAAVSGSAGPPVLVGWVAGVGLMRIEVSEPARWVSLPSGLAPGAPVQAVAPLEAGAESRDFLVGGTGGLVRVSVAAAGARSRQLSERPVFALAPAGSADPQPAATRRNGWWAGTDRGVVAFDASSWTPVAPQGVPVRRFNGVALLDAERLLAVSDGGDLYEYDPARTDEPWRLYPWPRPARPGA